MPHSFPLPNFTFILKSASIVACGILVELHNARQLLETCLYLLQSVYSVDVVMKSVILIHHFTISPFHRGVKHPDNMSITFEIS